MLNSPSHIKDVDGYIHFSPRTQGFVGRPVKIHTSLFIDFLCAVDPNTADGQAVIRDIEGLKATAHNTGATAPVKPMGGRNDSGKHKAGLDKAYQAIARMQHHRQMVRENSLITKSVRVYYHIHQRFNDQFPTVYISEIQVVQRETREAGGFYEAKMTSRGRVAAKVNSCGLENKTVFISAASDVVKDALSSAKALTNKRDPVLFFSPANVAEDLTVWKDSRLTGPTKNLVNELATTIKKNQNKSVEWIVEGEGAALLSHAVAALTGSLEQHSFSFVNPKANLPKLLQGLGQRKARLEGDFIKLTPTASGAAFGSALAVASQKHALLKQLTALPATQSNIPEQGVANKILRLSLINRVAAIGSSSRAQTVAALPLALRGGQKTFVDALRAVRGV